MNGYKTQYQHINADECLSRYKQNSARTVKEFWNGVYISGYVYSVTNEGGYFCINIVGSRNRLSLTSDYVSCTTMAASYMKSEQQEKIYSLDKGDPIVVFANTPNTIGHGLRLGECHILSEDDYDDDGYIYSRAYRMDRILEKEKEEKQKIEDEGKAQPETSVKSALAGCVIGLAVIIGVIFLIFKGCSAIIN